MAEELKNGKVEETEDQTSGAAGTGAEGGNTKTEENGNGKSTDEGGKSSGSTEHGKTFTQEQLNRMMTREKNQGRAAAFNELGIDPKDAKAVAMVKALIESQKSDEQKKLEKQAAENDAIAEANKRAQLAEAKAEAMMLGVQKQYVEDVVTLALAQFSDDNNDLKTIIGELKTKYPVWFGEVENDKDAKNKTGQKGTGTSIKGAEKGAKKGEEEKSLGQRLAAQRRSSGGKKTYWGKDK